MFGSIGMPEMIIILVIALIIFGPRKLPELGRSLGKSLAEFKRASNELRNTLEEEIRLEDQKAKVEAPKAGDQSPVPTPVEAHEEPLPYIVEGPVTPPDEPVAAGTSEKVDKSA